MYESNWIATGSIATAVMAFFTLTLILLNLYLILIKPWWKRPRFSIEFNMDEPFCRKTFSSKFNPYIPANKDVDVLDTHWVRVRVRNSGKSVAHRCLSKLIEIWNYDESTVIDQFDPTQLHWVGTSWREVPFRDASLNHQEYEYLDVLATQQGDESLYICGDQFPLAQYEPRGIRNCLKPGSYILRITAYGDSVDPETKYLSMIWRGRHFKDISVEIHDTFEKAKAWLGEKRSG